MSAQPIAPMSARIAPSWSVVGVPAAVMMVLAVLAALLAAGRP